MRGEKYGRGGIHALFIPFTARVPPFYFAVAGWKRWMARAREKKRSLAKRGRGGRGGMAADIAKELHVTRKFVYTMSAPLAPCNVY